MQPLTRTSNSLTRNDPKLSKTIAIQSKEIFLGCKYLIDFVSVETINKEYNPKTHTDYNKMIEIARNAISNCKQLLMMIQEATNQILPNLNNEESISLRTSLNRQISKATIAVRNSVNKVNKHSITFQTCVTEIIRTTTEAIKGKMQTNQELLLKLKERLKETGTNIKEILIASENWKLIDSEHADQIEFQNHRNNALKLAKSAVYHIQKLVASTKIKSEQAIFVKHAKSALSALNSILNFSKKLDLIEDEQNLRELTHQFIVTAKEAYQNPKDFLDPLNLVVENIALAIKQLLINSKEINSSFLQKNTVKTLFQQDSDKKTQTPEMQNSPETTSERKRGSRTVSRQDLEINIKRLSNRQIEYEKYSHEELITLHAALVIQSRVRYWMVKKQLFNAVQNVIKDVKRQQKMRSNALEELVDSEINYYQQLQTLVKSYLQPIKTKNKSISTSDQIQHLTDSVSSAIKLSKNILQHFKERLDAWNEDDPSTHILGDVFMKTAPLLEQYVNWCHHFSAANRLIINEKYNEPQLDILLKELQEGANGVVIDVFLDLPSKRIPQYEVLLDTILRYTPNSHPDFENLTKALKIIKQINDVISEKRREEENKIRLEEISKCIISKTPLDLIKPNRILIREGPMSDILKSKSIFNSSKKQVYYYFMFSDIMVKTRPETKTKKRSFQFVEFINFKGMKIQSVSDNESINTFQITCDDGKEKKSHNCICLSEDEKNFWIQDLSDAQFVQNTLELIKDQN
eukprot:TRINITY_DN3530_c0_g1_i1.p1 TRINITY_DN3530_c0_g1~~TRINITY_DN3530_c0_g1_i1.p1  ORF type:complete len:748 (-),score=181.80 TRINITY_DN3530_c0_g1_i1:683-2926(-)